MNERICELKEAAMEVIFSSPSTGREQKQLNVDKFAELIVRECSKIITQGGYWNHALKGRTPASPSEIAKMVEDYFGVEE